MKNYYNILNVSSTADQVQIKKAYRGLCKKYHPDRHGGSRYHEEKFKEINEAYRVLMDPLKRNTYNRQLVVRVRPRPQQSSAPASEPRGNWGPPEYAPQSAGRPHTTSPAGEKGSGGFFWSVMLVLVFFLPFWMSNTGEASPAPAQTVHYDVLEKINQRYQQEVYYLNEIKRIDPDLTHLDLNTGYYRLNGRTIRLSWDTLKLIRKNGWKVQS